MKMAKGVKNKNKMNCKKVKEMAFLLQVQEVFSVSHHVLQGFTWCHQLTLPRWSDEALSNYFSHGCSGSHVQQLGPLLSNSGLPPAGDSCICSSECTVNGFALLTSRSKFIFGTDITTYFVNTKFPLPSEQFQFCCVVNIINIIHIIKCP